MKYEEYPATCEISILYNRDPPLSAVSGMGNWEIPTAYNMRQIFFSFFLFISHLYIIIYIYKK